MLGDDKRNLAFLVLLKSAELEIASNEAMLCCGHHHTDADSAHQARESDMGQTKTCQDKQAVVQCYATADCKNDMIADGRTIKSSKTKSAQYRFTELSCVFIEEPHRSWTSLG